MGDVTAEDFPKKIVQATVDKYGRIDILINNAGTLGYSALPCARQAKKDAHFLRPLILPVHGTK